LRVKNPSDAKAREAAAGGLRIRRDQDYTAILLDGLRYPWPVVARRAAEALVRLERKDLLLHLIATLEAPDPRLPEQREGVWQVRELVRINHHRNCLLCHAPAKQNTLLRLRDPSLKTLQTLRDEVSKVLREAKLREERENLLAPMPLPNRSFDQGKDTYRGDHEMERILVRVDVTYLRQDFSAMLPVENAAPWPDFQRFDFLVRTRNMPAAEATALRQRLQPGAAGRVSPYQQAALFGLRELTGLEATSALEWRRLLKLPAPIASGE